ncbi:hypothetical protein ACWGDX_00200 [Streptomyces sp. NPDC055025]
MRSTRRRPTGTASTARTPTSRRPATRKATAEPVPAAAPAVDPRFENGPLAVVDVADGQVSAYCVGGPVLDVPAKSVPALAEWTLKEARLGQPRLHRNGEDADPVLIDRDNPRLPSMGAADLARFLGTYASRVMTPRGTTAPGALTAVHEHVPCEVPDGHPVLKGTFARHHQRTPAEMLMEESYDWRRPLTDAECMKQFVVGIDINETIEVDL